MKLSSREVAQAAARQVLAACGEDDRPDHSPRTQKDEEDEDNQPRSGSSPSPQMAKRIVTAAEQLRENLMRKEMPAAMKPIEPPKPPKPPKPFKPKKPGSTKDFRLGSTAGTI